MSKSYISAVKMPKYNYNHHMIIAWYAFKGNIVSLMKLCKFILTTKMSQEISLWLSKICKRKFNAPNYQIPVPTYSNIPLLKSKQEFMHNNRY